MCGRFTLTVDVDAIEQYFGLQGLQVYLPHYNIAPSQSILTIYQNNLEQTQCVYMQWGFVPHWAKCKLAKSAWINARSETVAEKPAFRQAFAKKRCLIPADGYYEWQPVDEKNKQPYYCYLEGHKLFALAGIWDESIDAEGNRLETCAILTGQANSKLSSIHDRMPVVIPKQYYQDWLDPLQDKNKLKAIVDTRHNIDDWQAHPVSTQVNKPSVDTASCIKPIDIYR